MSSEAMQGWRAALAVDNLRAALENARSRADLEVVLVSKNPDGTSHCLTLRDLRDILTLLDGHGQQPVGWTLVGGEDVS